MRRGKLDGQQVLLGTRATDNDCNMVRRASCGTQRFHLLYQERNQRAFVLDTRFGLLIEIGLVGTSATLCHAQEVVLHSLRCLQVNLRRQVTLGIHLVVHIKRGVLAITQVAGCIGVIDAFRQGFFVRETGPHLLSFLAVDDSGTGVLAQRQLAFGCYFGITQEGQRHVFVVSGSLGVAQDFCDLFVMLATQQEAHILKCALRHHREAFFRHLQHRFAFKLANRHIVFGQQIVLSFVLTELEHRFIMKCHILIFFVKFHNIIHAPIYAYAQNPCKGT